MLPTESEENKNVGSEDALLETTTTTEANIITTANTTDNASAVVNNDNLIESLDQQNTQHTTNISTTDDNPKLEQLLLDSLAAVVTSSSSAGVTSSLCLGGGNGGSNQCSQNSNDPAEMPQLMSILNELLDGSDLSSLTNTGGNGDTMQDIRDMEDQEEAYEDDSPRKDDPDEIDRQLVAQKLEDISRVGEQLHRRMDFLIRRLYKLVARSAGLHASEEIAGFVEHVARHYKRKEKELKEQHASKTQTNDATNFQGSNQILSPPPTELPDNILSSPTKSQEPNVKDVIDTKSVDVMKAVPQSELKSFLRRIENISTLQSTNLSKRTYAMKYFTKPSPNNLLSMPKSMMNALTNAVPRFDWDDANVVDQVSGLLETELRIIGKNVDSDATASSSGGESADEMVAYNNQHQQPLSISKRAAYKFAKDRGAVASRWCWLATQISELDYKIRQHTDLRKHIKENKGAVTLEVIAGFEGQLPGSNRTKASSFTNNETDDNDEFDDGLAARVRPLLKTSFRKRKLVQTENLHLSSKKAARPSTIKCGCQWPLQPCALCTGRQDPTAPRDLPDTLATAERVALLDPGFHPVLSFPDDVSSNIHLEAIMNIPEWQSKMLKSSPKTIMKHVTREIEMLSSGNVNVREEQQKQILTTRTVLGDDKKVRKYNIDVLTGKRKYTKKLKLVDGGFVSKLKERRKYRKKSLPLSPGGHPTRKYTFKKRIRKLQNDAILYSHQNSYSNAPVNGLNGVSEKHYDLLNRSKNSSPVPTHRSEKKMSESRSNRNYDIDNIVIPYSVAASTRPEVLSYAEIPTPKWRIITAEDDKASFDKDDEMYNGADDHEPEETSEEHYTVLHDRALIDERKKFETFLKFPLTSRSRANRRIDSRGNESSGANTPIIVPTTPPPGEFEPVPSADGQESNEPASITALLNNINGRKERSRTSSRKEDDGLRSGTVSRCHSPNSIKEMIPAYEPLHFPLTEVCIQKMKRLMPSEHLNDVAKYFANPKNHERRVVVPTSQRRPISRPHQKRPRRHNDSISESKLIKDKLPSVVTVGKTNNVLIPRNKSPNILELIDDLTAKDAAMLKQYMNNNNGDSGLNGDDFDDDTENNIFDNSDSETVTGTESNCDLGDDSDSDFR